MLLLLLLMLLGSTGAGPSETSKTHLPPCSAKQHSYMKGFIASAMQARAEVVVVGSVNLPVSLEPDVPHAG